MWGRWSLYTEGTSYMSIRLDYFLPTEQTKRHEWMVRIFINRLHQLTWIYVFYTYKLHSCIHGVCYQPTTLRIFPNLQKLRSSMHFATSNMKLLRWFDKKKIKKTNNFSMRNEKNHQLFLFGPNMQGWPTWIEIRKKFARTGELKSVKFCTSFISDPPFCALFLKKKYCDLGTQLLKCISGFDHELLWWPTGQ